MRHLIAALALLISIAAVVVAVAEARAQRRVSRDLLQQRDELASRVATLERVAPEVRNVPVDPGEPSGPDFSNPGGVWLELTQRAQELPWVGGEGAPVEARLAVVADVLHPGSPVPLLVEVRNASDREITVGGIEFYSWTTKLSHDGRPVSYIGVTPGMSSPDPVTLPPGRIMRAYAGFTTETHREIAQPGEFTAEWTYHSYKSPGGGKVTWGGNLPPVKVSWRAQ